MALGYMGTLAAVFDEADTPDALKHWLQSTVGIRRVSDLVDYVHKDQYDKEWRSLVMGAFPVMTDQTKRDAVPAAGDTPATAAAPAVEGFPERKQRMLVSRMRTTYRVALGMERKQAEDTKAAGSHSQTPRGQKRAANSQSAQGTLGKQAARGPTEIRITT